MWFEPDTLSGDVIKTPQESNQPPAPAVKEPTLFVAGGIYSESWLRENGHRLGGALAEFASKFMAAVELARATAAQHGTEPELRQMVTPAPSRHAPDIPVRYEAPPPWRVVQIEAPAIEARIAQTVRAT